MQFDSAKRDPSYLEWIAMFHLRPNGSAGIRGTHDVCAVAARCSRWLARALRAS
jgi:hypothetical protein